MEKPWHPFDFAGLILCAILVLTGLYSLDKYDEYQAEREAAEALEPNLQFHPASSPPERQWMDLCLYDEHSKTKATDDFRYVTVELQDGRMAHIDREAGKVWITP